MLTKLKLFIGQTHYTIKVNESVVNFHLGSGKELFAAIFFGSFFFFFIFA